MFGSKYRATLKYKTQNNFIIGRKDELRLLVAAVSVAVTFF